MAHPDVEYVTYGTAPLRDGAQLLRAKLFHPELGPGEAAPLLVWFHRGGFSEGSLEAPLATRIGRIMARWGYATAVLETRPGATAHDLLPATQAALPELLDEAAATNPDLPEAFTGAAALAAMEDGVAFLSWVRANGAALGLSGRVMLGGSSSGAVTVLNILNLAPTLGLVVPRVSTAVVISGGYAYPSRAAGLGTRLLALHGAADTTIPPASMRAYALAAGRACTLLEGPEHHHGALRLSPDETLRQGVARLAQFDRGPFQPGGLRAQVVAPRRHRVCLTASVGAEGPYLLEWLAHHRRIGVTDFVLFSDLVEDGTEEMLTALHDRGLILHLPNPAPELRSRQSRAVARALAPFARAVRAADYVIEASVSDFIEVPVADGTLDGLIAVTGAPEVLELPALRFGFGGVGRLEDGLVSAQFTRACPSGPGLQIRRRGAAATAPVTALPPDAARLRRYPLRSAEAFLLRLALSQGSARLPYRLLTAWNVDAQSQPAPRGLPALRAAVAELMRDEALMQLHRRSVSWHRQAIAQLWTDPGTREAWAFMAPLIGAKEDRPDGADHAGLAAE